MLSLQPILERLQEKTTFDIVTKSTAIKPNLVKLSLTASFISYENIDSKGEGYADYGERLLATLLVQLTTSSEREEEDLRQVKAALSQWSPNDVYNRELSAFSLEKAELMDINNEHYNWFLLFNIITPTLNGEC